jgi:uncharacterized membrane protein
MTIQVFMWQVLFDCLYVHSSMRACMQNLDGNNRWCKNYIIIMQLWQFLYHKCTARTGLIVQKLAIPRATPNNLMCWVSMLFLNTPGFKITDLMRQQSLIKLIWLRLITLSINHTVYWSANHICAQLSQPISSRSSHSTRQSTLGQQVSKFDFWKVFMDNFHWSRWTLKKYF